MGLIDLIRKKKKEALIGVDIGSSSVKLVGLDISSDVPGLLDLGIAPLKGDVFSNNVIANPSKVAEAISTLLHSQSSSERRAVTAVPSPSVFTKKIKVPKMGFKELDTNIQFEAGNFIPHNINAVRLDYHIIGESTKNQLDVLVAAVKNEIIDGFVSALFSAGLNTAVVDVDCFALQNVFELNYPEFFDRTVALLNIGVRYSSINICKNGESLFTGDIAVGGRLFTDALAEVYGLSYEDAEAVKLAGDKRSSSYSDASDIIKKSAEQAATEFNRQLSFFWNASGSDEGIDCIFLSGGGACVPGLTEEMSDKTGIETRILDPFKAIEVPSSFDSHYLKSVGPMVALCVGLAMRQPADKIIPSFM